ncbi:hypothetical protein [Alcaligenes phenolicus]
MSLNIDPRRQERYHVVGVEWKRNRHLRLAVVGERVLPGMANVRIESHEADQDAADRCARGLPPDPRVSPA